MISSITPTLITSVINPAPIIFRLNCAINTESPPICRLSVKCRFKSDWTAA